MSDRIAIFESGRIQQLGTGTELYERPASIFVADFVGESNLFRGRVRHADGGSWLVRGDWRWRVDPGLFTSGPIDDGGAAAIVVRPEHLDVVAPGTDVGGRNHVPGVVSDVLYLGPSRKLELRLPDGTAAVVRQPAGADGAWRPGDEVRLAWPVERGVVVHDREPATTA